MSYRSQITQWFKDNGYSFNSNLSDKELYNVADSLYKASSVSHGGAAHSEHADKKMFYLVPHMENDGSVYYMDRLSGEMVMSITRQPNGLFSYYGPKEMMEIFGGRGLMSQINSNMEDGDFFHNPEKKR